MCAKVVVDSVDTQRRTICVIQPNGRLTIEKIGVCAQKCQFSFWIQKLTLWARGPL